MNRIGELYNKHKGQRIMIMGGSPSLPDELKQHSADIYISCNHHAVSHYKTDYITAMDGAIDGVAMCEFMRQFDAPLISPYKRFGKYHIDLIARPTPDTMVNTGIMSIFIAKQMGASEIICCGFDFYQGGDMYFDSQQNVRASNKTRTYFDKCIKRINELDAPVWFVNAAINQAIVKARNL